MKVGKSFTTLLALGLLLGLGVRNSAEAVSATEIVVTSPAQLASDDVTELNIENNEITVEITFTELNAAVSLTEKAFEINIGLANITADPAVGLTTLNAGATGRILDDASDAGEEAAFAGILAVASSATTLPGNSVGGGSAYVTGGSGRVLGNITIPYFSAALSGTDLGGNVTAAEISVAEFDNVTVTATIEVGSDAGTADNIVAFTVVQETTGPSTGALVFSDIDGAVDGDWDAPEIGTIVLTAITERLDDDGDVTDDPDIVTGSSHAPIAPGDRITVEVSATGDTQNDFFVDRILGVDVTLSGQDDITTLTMDPGVRSDAGAATQSYIVLEGDDADDDGVAPDVGDQVRVIATVTSVDENGNPSANETGITVSGADITVSGNTDEAVFVGTAAAGETALDTNPPVLEFAASPGVLPAAGGTISDGGLNAGDATLPSDGFGNAAVGDVEAVDNAGLIQYENDEAWKTFSINFDNGEADDSDDLVNTTITLSNTGNTLLSAAFDAAADDEIRFVDFSDLDAVATTAAFDADGDRALTGGDTYSATFSGAVTPSLANGNPAIPSGIYTLTYSVTDMADNASNDLVAEGVIVDVDDFEFESLAPPATETTINENTANPS